MQPPTRKVRVDYANGDEDLPADLVRRVVAYVLDGENVGPAEFSVTFLSGQRMRAFNRRIFGVDRATDVLAFELPHPGVAVGDIYLCPSVARRVARGLKESEQEEMVRLIVHGTLHALGYEHPTGDERCSSEMWLLQEQYLKTALRGEV